jgi:hypothetical protein
MYVELVGHEGYRPGEAQWNLPGALLPVLSGMVMEGMVFGKIEDQKVVGGRDMGCTGRGSMLLYTPFHGFDVVARRGYFLASRFSLLTSRFSPLASHLSPLTSKN